MAFTDILQSLLTPVIAAVTVYIAYRQYHIDKQEKAFALYDRRLRVYREFHAILSYIGGGHPLDYKKYSSWLQSVAEAEFIFGDEVFALLESLSDAVGDYYQFSSPDFKFDDPMGAGAAANRVAAFNPAIIDTFRPYLSSPFREQYAKGRLSEKEVASRIPPIDPQAKIESKLDSDDVPF